MLSKLADIALIAFVVFACTFLYMHESAAPRPRADFYKVGESIKGLRINTATTTLVFAVSTKCPHCAKMMPTFQRLAADAHAKGVRTVVVSGEEPREVVGWLNSFDMHVDEVMAAEDSGLEVRATPLTMVIQGGKVLAFRAGEFDEAGRDRIIAVID